MEHRLNAVSSITTHTNKGAALIRRTRKRFRNKTVSLIREIKTDRVWWRCAGVALYTAGLQTLAAAAVILLGVPCRIQLHAWKISFKVSSTTYFGNTTPYWGLIRGPQHYHTDFVIKLISLWPVLSKHDQTDTTKRTSEQKNLDFTSVG